MMAALRNARSELMIWADGWVDIYVGDGESPSGDFDTLVKS